MRWRFGRELFVGFVAFAGAVASRADWPNFLGPRYDGKSDEKGLKTKWDEPLKLLWEREVGSAFSSFAWVGNRVYTCGEQDKQQVLYCLDADTGAVVWQKPFEKQYRNEHGDGTRATPTWSPGFSALLSGTRPPAWTPCSTTSRPPWRLLETDA